METSRLSTGYGRKRNLTCLGVGPTGTILGVKRRRKEARAGKAGQHYDSVKLKQVSDHLFLARGRQIHV